MCGDGTVHNEKFYTMRIPCEKVGLIYSQRKKWFMILALNDFKGCYVLFENKELEKLPNISPILLEHNKVEKANHVMNAAYDEIIDVTTNPYQIYKTSELFRK